MEYSTASISRPRTKGPRPSFMLGYKREKISPKERTGLGTCWHKVFKNPVIVRGFPILARNNDERGLEIPLNIMATLGGADRATIFGDQLLIKGHATMFVPTKRVQNSVLWHFIHKENGERISFAAAKTLCPTRATIDIVDYSCLMTSRSFLGWASSVQLCTGTPDKIPVAFFGSADCSSPHQGQLPWIMEHCVLREPTILRESAHWRGSTYPAGKPLQWDQCFLLERKTSLPASRVPILTEPRSFQQVD
jgi:hypothetical protein